MNDEFVSDLRLLIDNGRFELLEAFDVPFVVAGGICACAPREYDCAPTKRALECRRDEQTACCDQHAA